MPQKVDSDNCPFCGNSVAADLKFWEKPGWVGYICKDKISCQGKSYGKIVKLLSKSISNKEYS